MIAREEIIDRQNALRRFMEQNGIDAVCIGGSSQIDTRGALRYFTGYYLPVFEEYLVIPREGAVVFFPHDASGADHAKNFAVVDDIRPIPDIQYVTDPAAGVVRYLKDIGCATVGTSWGREVSAAFYISFMKHIGGIKTCDVAPAIAAMRMVKSPAELELMKDAVRLNEEVLAEYLSHAAVGKSEIAAVNAASAYACSLGAEDLYWMAASAKVPTLSFLASARRLDHVWEKGDYHYIVIEHSAAGGYYSEITQLVSFGTPKDEYVRAYAAVAAAQDAAAALILPGTPVARLAEASQDVLADLGYVADRASPAPTIGHSQGLDAWELPRISGDETAVIKPGMRFNIHPAVVLPDGAKITSCITCLSTENGHEVISDLPKEIVVV